MLTLNPHKKCGLNRKTMRERNARVNVRGLREVAWGNAVPFENATIVFRSHTCGIYSGAAACGLSATFPIWEQPWKASTCIHTRHLSLTERFWRAIMPCPCRDQQRWEGEESRVGQLLCLSPGPLHGLSLPCPLPSAGQGPHGGCRGSLRPTFLKGHQVPDLKLQNIKQY